MVDDDDTYLHEVCEERDALRDDLRWALDLITVYAPQVCARERYQIARDRVDGRTVGRRAVAQLRRETGAVKP